MKVCIRPEFFHKNMSHEQLLFMWSTRVQSWNIFEELMKVWSPPEFIHKNMFHEQLPFMWSTFRDSSMGTKLKYFLKTHEIAKSAMIFSQKMSHEQLLFMWSTFRDSSMGTKLKYFWKAH